MSYDIYLRTDIPARDSCACCGRPAEKENEHRVDIGNYTSNVTGMWNKALGYWLSDTDGRRAGDLVTELEAAVANMSDPAEAEVYEAMAPANKWGSVAGATQYLRNLLEACQDHPDAIIEVSH